MAPRQNKDVNTKVQKALKINSDSAHFEIRFDYYPNSDVNYPRNSALLHFPSLKGRGYHRSNSYNLPYSYGSVMVAHADALEKEYGPRAEFDLLRNSGQHLLNDEKHLRSRGRSPQITNGD